MWRIKKSAERNKEDDDKVAIVEDIAYQWPRSELFDKS